jgi:hypothetical protein
VMPLTMRPTGLSSPIDQHLMDYTIYSGEWPMGRIHEEEEGVKTSAGCGHCSAFSPTRPACAQMAARRHLRPQKQSSRPTGGNGSGGRSWARSALGSVRRAAKQNR